MVEDVGYLNDIIILLISAVFIVAVFKKLQLGPVLGYFSAGLILGPSGIALDADTLVSSMAEFGVVFLLFTIGLELTFSRLRSMKLHVFGFGTLQTLISASFISIFSKYLGLGTEASLIIGGALAFSSTAVVLQVLHDSGQNATQVGRLSIAILIMQDLLVVPLLALVPLLQQDLGNSLIFALLKTFGNAIVSLLIILFAGRVLLRPLFKAMASFRSNELFVAFTLLVVLGSAHITASVGLSMALGAFVAGLLVAETEFCHEVEQTILPFKNLLLGLFFMSVGMTTDLELIYTDALNVGAMAIGLLSFKAITIIVLCNIFKFSLGTSINAGLMLAQGGEFAFILFNMAGGTIISERLAQTLMATVTVTMALTPILAKLGNIISKKIDNALVNDDQSILHKTRDIDRHIVIAGFGRVGKMVARMMNVEKIAYVAVDANVSIVEKETKNGFPIYRGDFTDYRMLECLRLQRAIAIVVTVNNEVTLRKSVKTIKEHFPNIAIIVRVTDLTNKRYYENMGVDILIPATYETGLQMGAAALSQLGLDKAYLAQLKNQFRSGSYTHIVADMD